MKNSNSAIQKIRRTAGRPIDLTRRREQLKIAATLAAFSLEMYALGLNYAMVMCDPDQQKPNETVLGFGGNVSLESGSLLMQTFLMLQKDKNATRTDLSVADSSPAAPAESNPQNAIDAVIETLASTYIPENVTN